MSTSVTTSFKKRYKDMLELLLQQKKSKFRATVEEEMIDGQYQFFDRIGSVSMAAISGRHAATAYTNTPHDRRRMELADYAVADRIDWQDIVRVGLNPQAPYVRNILAAINRQIDDTIIAAFYATAATGVDGAGTQAFDTNNIIDASTTVGLSINKMVDGRRVLLGNEAIDDGEATYLAVSAKQIADLLKTTQVTSADFNTVKALAQGEVNSFVGFEIVRSERLPLADTDDRRCFGWTKSAMKLGIGKDIGVEIDRLPDYNYTTQIYGRISLGAIRMEEGKVIDIRCDE